MVIFQIIIKCGAHIQNSKSPFLYNSAVSESMFNTQINFGKIQRIISDSSFQLKSQFNVDARAPSIPLLNFPFKVLIVTYSPQWHSQDFQQGRLKLGSETNEWGGGRDFWKFVHQNGIHVYHNYGVWVSYVREVAALTNFLLFSPPPPLFF